MTRVRILPSEVTFFFFCLSRIRDIGPVRVKRMYCNTVLIVVVLNDVNIKMHPWDKAGFIICICGILICEHTAFECYSSHLY